MSLLYQDIIPYHMTHSASGNVREENSDIIY